MLVDRVWSKLRLALLILPLLGLAACAGTSAPPLSSREAPATFTEYRLGLGDRVRINVFGERDLSGDFQVSGTGGINMPLIGDVQAVGATAQELERKLVAALANGYLKDPKVQVEVTNFRPYYILGEVSRPGSYAAREGMTIEGAIATAGGFTYRADKKRVFIRRAGEAQEYQLNPSQPVQVRPGDTLRVGERFF